MSAILKFYFQKRKQLHFSEENDLDYTIKTQFCMCHNIFPKTRGNKNKQWTHLGALKDELILLLMLSFVLFKFKSNPVSCIEMIKL